MFQIWRTVISCDRSPDLGLLCLVKFLSIFEFNIHRKTLKIVDFGTAFFFLPVPNLSFFLPVPNLSLWGVGE